MKKLVSILIIMFFILIVGIQNVNAQGNNSMYTDLYKAYLNLSDEEKAKVKVIPNKYKVPIEIIYDETEEVKEEPSFSNWLGLFANNRLQTLGAENIPESFNLADKINIKIEDQGELGNCWAFASLETLETYLMLHGYKEQDFSEKHLAYIESEEFSQSISNVQLFCGGNFSYFKDYVKNRFGPVTEEEVPYDKTYNKDEYATLLNMTPMAYVGEVKNFASIESTKKANGQYTQDELRIFREQVKKHIMENGSLYTAICAPMSDSTYYNPETGAAYLSEDNNYEIFFQTGHGVSIIGWDDNYSRMNFKANQRPRNDGAYIVLNSWGESWGDKGFYYISYEDIYVEESLAGVLLASDNQEDLERKLNGEDDNPNDTPKKTYQEIQFNDINLYNAIKEKFADALLNENSASMTLEISNKGVYSTFKLDLSNKNITDLSGIEYFQNVEELNLSNNNITDMTNLKYMPKLLYVNLSNNNLTQYVNFRNSNLSANNRYYNSKYDYKYDYDYDEYNYNYSYNSDYVQAEERIDDYNYYDYLDDYSEYNNYRKLYEKGYTVPINDIFIRELDLSGNNWTDLTELTEIPISTLKLNNCGLNDEDINILRNVKPVLFGDKENNPEGSEELYLELAYNDFRDLEDITNGYNLIGIDLSGNKNIDLTTLSKVGITIKLEDCDLTDVSALEYMHCSSLYLARNPGIILSTIPCVGTLDISSCELTNLNGLTYPNFELFINDNAIDENDLDYVQLESKDVNYYRLDLNNTNIKDVSELGRLTNIKELYMCGDENVENIDKLVNVEYLHMNNCKISSVSQFKNLNQLKWLELKYNNIENYGELEELISSENLVDLDLTGNQITSLLGLTGGWRNIILDDNKIEGGSGWVKSAKNNKVEKNITIIRGLENRFDDLFWFLREIVGYSKEAEAKFENCEFTYSPSRFVIKNKYSSGVASVTIKGGKYDGYEFKINYTVVDDMMPIDIEIQKNEDYGAGDLYTDGYLVGKNFEKNKIKVFAVYDNGAKVELSNSNYEVINGDNLELGQNSVTIRYKGIEKTYPIYVFDESSVTKIRFNDKALYNAIVKFFKNDRNENFRLLNYTRPYVSILNDARSYYTYLIDNDNATNEITIANSFFDEQDECLIGIEDYNVTDLTGLSAFSNITNLAIIGANIYDISEILNLSNLTNLAILNNGQIINIKGLDRCSKLEYVNINNVLMNSGNVPSVLANTSLKGQITNKELSIKDGKYVLPSYIKELMDRGKTIRATTTYLKKDEKYVNAARKTDCQIATDGNDLLLSLDEEMGDGKTEINRYVYLEVLGEDGEVISTLRIDYKTLEMIVKEIGNNKFLTNLKINGNLYESILSKLNFPNAERFIATDKNGNVLKATEKLGTGTHIEMLDSRDQVIDAMTAIVNGDVTGDGVLDVLDLSQVVFHLIDKYKLDNVYEIAGDVNSNGELDVVDLSQMVLALIEKIKL